MAGYIAWCFSALFGICYVFICILYQILQVIYNFNIEVSNCFLSVIFWFLQTFRKCDRNVKCDNSRYTQTKNRSMLRNQTFPIKKLKLFYNYSRNSKNLPKTKDEEITEVLKPDIFKYLSYGSEKHNTISATKRKISQKYEYTNELVNIPESENNVIYNDSDGKISLIKSQEISHAWKIIGKNVFETEKPQISSLLTNCIFEQSRFQIEISIKISRYEIEVDKLIFETANKLTNFNLYVSNDGYNEKYIFRHVCICKEGNVRSNNNEIQKEALSCTLENRYLPKYTTFENRIQFNTKNQTGNIYNEHGKVYVISHYNAASSLPLYLDSKDFFKQQFRNVSRNEPQNLWINRNNTTLNLAKLEIFKKKIKRFSMSSGSKEINIDQMQSKNFLETETNPLDSKIEDAYSNQNILSVVDEYQTNVNELKQARVVMTMAENINEYLGETYSNTIQLNIAEMQLVEMPKTANAKVPEKKKNVLEKVKTVFGKGKLFNLKFLNCTEIVDTNYALQLLTYDAHSKILVEKRNTSPLELDAYYKTDIRLESNPYKYCSIMIGNVCKSDFSMQSIFTLNNNCSSQLVDIYKKNSSHHWKTYFEANGSICSEIFLSKSEFKLPIDNSSMNAHDNFNNSMLCVNDGSIHSDVTLEINPISMSKDLSIVNANNQMEFTLHIDGNSVFNVFDWKMNSKFFFIKTRENRFEVYSPAIHFNNQSECYSKNRRTPAINFIHGTAYLETFIQRINFLKDLYSGESTNLPSIYNQISRPVLMKDMFFKWGNMSFENINHFILQYKYLNVEMHFDKIKIDLMKKNQLKCFTKKDNEDAPIDIFEGKNIVLRDDKTQSSEVTFEMTEVTQPRVMLNTANPLLINIMQSEFFPFKDQSVRLKVSKEKNVTSTNILHSEEIEIISQPSVIDTKHNPHFQSRDICSSQSMFSNLCKNIEYTPRMSSRLGDIDTSIDDGTISLNIHASQTKSNDEQIKTLPKFKTARLVSKHSLNLKQNTQKTLSSSNKCFSGNIKSHIKPSIGKNCHRRNIAKRKLQAKEFKREEIICSAKEIKQSTQNCRNELLDFSAFTVPHCLVNVNMRDFKCYIDKPLKIKRLHHKDDFEKNWNESDIIFCRTVMENELSEDYLTATGNITKHSHGKTYSFMSSPKLCNGVQKKVSEFTLGKRKVKCIVRNQTGNTEKNVIEKHFERFQGVISGNLRILKVPVNCPKSKFSSTNYENEDNVKCMTSSYKCSGDSRNPIYEADDKCKKYVKCVENSFLSKVENKRNSLQTPTPIRVLDNNLLSNEKVSGNNCEAVRCSYMASLSEADNNKFKKVSRKKKNKI